MLMPELEGFVEVFLLKTTHLQKASVKRLLGKPGMNTSGRGNHVHEFVDRVRFMDVSNTHSQSELRGRLGSQTGGNERHVTETLTGGHRA